MRDVLYRDAACSGRLLGRRYSNSTFDAKPSQKQQLYMTARLPGHDHCSAKHNPVKPLLFAQKCGRKHVRRKALVGPPQFIVSTTSNRY